MLLVRVKSAKMCKEVRVQSPTSIVLRTLCELLTISLPSPPETPRCILTACGTSARRAKTSLHGISCHLASRTCPSATMVAFTSQSAMRTVTTPSGAAMVMDRTHGVIAPTRTMHGHGVHGRHQSKTGAGSRMATSGVRSKAGMKARNTVRT